MKRATLAINTLLEHGDKIKFGSLPEDLKEAVTKLSSEDDDKNIKHLEVLVHLLSDANIMNDQMKN